MGCAFLDYDTKSVGAVRYRQLAEELDNKLKREVMLVSPIAPAPEAASVEVPSAIMDSGESVPVSQVVS